MTKKEERVWKYLLANRKASSSQVAEATSTSVEYVDKMIETISSPNWREEVPVPKFVKADEAKTRYDLLHQSCWKKQRKYLRSAHRNTAHTTGRKVHLGVDTLVL